MANNRERFKIRSSLVGRAFSTAKLSARLGMGASKQLLNIDPSNPEKAIEVAVKLANEFDSLKGLMMKFGQMASYLGTHLPPEAREALAKLQTSSSAMPFETVRGIVEADLEQPLEKCFDEFDETAFAAASIGQVHKATLNGVDVAVKVQYPDIKRLLSIDLMLVGNLFSGFTASTAMDGKGIAKELQARIMEECDYELEAYHQHKIRTAFANNENLASIITPATLIEKRPI